MKEYSNFLFIFGYFNSAHAQEPFYNFFGP